MSDTCNRTGEAVVDNAGSGGACSERYEILLQRMRGGITYMWAVCSRRRHAVHQICKHDMLMIVSEWHRIAYMLTVQAEAEANEPWEVL